jgi:pimeloyl-ACP methyl ester carboxylesterase
MFSKTVVAAAVLLLVGWNAVRLDAQSGVDGYWTGRASYLGDDLPIDIVLQSAPPGLEGFFSAPALRAYRYPLRNILVTGSNLTFELVGDAGAFAFNGSIDGNSLTGSWNLFGVIADVSMARGVLPPIPYTREAITCRNGSLTLAGTLLIPNGSGPYPAVVFVHGSGSETRDASNFLADRITREGVASLTFDKRGAGASNGDWREATFTDLARDVLACVDVLKVRRDIIRNKIGLAGASQAGWIAPLAASLSPDVAFLALISGPAVPVWREGWWDAEYRMRQRGFGATDIEKARTILRLNDEVTRTGRAFGELQRLVDVQRAEAWFPALGLPEPLPPPDAPFRRFYRRILDFDPLPILQRMSIPSLWLLGDRDAEMPSEETAAILEQLKQQGKQITIRMFSGADHSLFVAGEPSQSFRWPRVVPAYIDAFTDWIKGR